MNSYLIRLIFLVNLFLYTNVSYCSEKAPVTEMNNKINAEKVTDSILLTTKVGFLKIFSDCDSIGIYSSYISGEISKEQLNLISSEAERLNISTDKGSLNLLISNEGKIIKCEIEKYAKLNQINLILKEFADEINSKYKNLQIDFCNLNKENSIYSLPFYFYLD